MKYKIKKYKDGYSLYTKKHWYSTWKMFSNEYWVNLENMRVWLCQYLIKTHGHFKTKYGKTKLDNIYEV